MEICGQLASDWKPLGELDFRTVSDRSWRARAIAWAIAISACVSCGSNNVEVNTARTSVYDTDRAVVYQAVVDVATARYHRVEANPVTGIIKTAWEYVEDSLTNDGTRNEMTRSAIPGVHTQMRTRSFKRFFVRFEIAVTGARPWRVEVIGHASEWAPGTAQPVELHDADQPGWLTSRSDELVVNIYERLKGAAVPATVASRTQ
jgi:hypothetical protein